MITVYAEFSAGQIRNRFLDKDACCPFRSVLADTPRNELRRRWPQLGGRELDVLDGLLNGQGIAAIADHLDVHVSTVKTYRARAFAEIGIHFLSELVASMLNDT